MKKTIAALLLGATATLTFAQNRDEEQLLSLVAQARTRGCAEHAGVTVPLHWSPAVARAAARIQHGQPPISSVEEEGLRPDSIFHFTFTDYRTAADVANAFAKHFCPALTDAKFTEFGFHREDSKWVLVLVSPLTYPALDHRAKVLQRVLELTNEARSHARRCGSRAYDAAPPLRVNPLLHEAAATHAKDMASHNRIEHEGSDGTTPGQRATRAG